MPRRQGDGRPTASFSNASMVGYPNAGSASDVGNAALGTILGRSSSVLDPIGRLIIQSCNVSALSKPKEWLSHPLGPVLSCGATAASAGADCFGKHMRTSPRRSSPVCVIPDFLDARHPVTYVGNVRGSWRLRCGEPLVARLESSRMVVMWQDAGGVCKLAVQGQGLVPFGVET